MPWNPDPPQGFSRGQELVTIGRPPIPRFGAPQGGEMIVPLTPDIMAYELNDQFDLWLQRIPLTINSGQVPTTQFNYPFLINSIFSDLIGESEAELRSAGPDNIQLEYEIQNFNSITGELIAWVKLPLINNGDIINIYFDNPAAVDEQNPGAVWDVNYKSVLHLENNSNDSTINAQDFTEVNFSYTSGKIGTGGFFNGSRLIRNPYTVFPSTQFTIDFWINSAIGNDTIISYAIGNTGDDPQHVIVRMQLSLEAGIDGDVFNSGLDVTAGPFRKITITWDSVTGAVKVYRNSVLISSGTISVGLNLVNGGSLVIGQMQGSVGGGFSESFAGALDELRLSDIIRSDDRITTEFNNQNNPETFYNIEATEANSPELIHDIMAYEQFWFNLSWNKRTPLTINPSQVPTTQNNFPLLINSTFTDLIGESEAELRFAGLDNIQLEYEIQEFNTLTGKLIAWVKLSSVSDGDTIYIYYDNPIAIDEQDSHAVWDVNYSAVYHMNQSSGDVLDSTINGRDGTPAGNPTYLTPGKIGDAVDVDGVGDKFDVGPDLTVLGNAPRTVSMWADIDAFNDGGLFATADILTNDGDFSLRVLVFPTNTLRVQLWGPNDFDTLISGLAVGIHHIAVVYDGIDVILYFDGNEVNRQTVNLVTIPGNAMLGVWRDTRYFHGIIDETHFSTINRSADYIKTEYNNQVNPELFYNIGAEENRPDELLDRMGYE